MSLTFVNGKKTNQVSTLDRGLLYGDSLFETIAIQNKQPLALEAHLQRLIRGIDKLGFNKVDILQLKNEIDHFIELLDSGKHVLRITITRGIGGRGYLPHPDMQTTRILSAHIWPEKQKESLNMGLSEVKYAYQPLLAGIKHGNRLEQVLAAQAIPNDVDDVIMLDNEDNVVSASKGNIFFKTADTWLTPSIEYCGISGIIREEVVKVMNKHNITLLINDIPLTVLETKLSQGNIEEAFICNSILGITPIETLFETPLKSKEKTLKIKSLLQ